MRATPRGALIAVILTASLATPSASRAATPEESVGAEPSRRVRVVSSVGYDVAVGDPMEVRSGDGRSHAFRPNAGLVALIGVAWPLTLLAGTELQASFGVKYDARSDGGEEVGYSAFPLELLAAWSGGRARLAGGLSVALGPRLRGGDLSSDAADLRTSLGLAAQAEYVHRRPDARVRASLGLRAVWQKVEHVERPGAYGASTIGLFVGLSY